MEDLGATYDDHLRLVGKRVRDFLLVIVISILASLFLVTHCIFTPKTQRIYTIFELAMTELD